MRLPLLLLVGFLFHQSVFSQSKPLPFELVLKKERALLIKHNIKKRIKLEIKEAQHDTLEIAFYSATGLKDSILEPRRWFSEITCPPDHFPKWAIKKFRYNEALGLTEIEYEDGRCHKINTQRSPKYTYFDEFDEAHLIRTTGFQDSLGRIKGKNVYLLNEDHQVTDFMVYNQVSSQLINYQYNEQKQLVKLIKNDFLQKKPTITTYAYFDNGLLKTEKTVWYRKEQRIEHHYEYHYQQAL